MIGWAVSFVFAQYLSLPIAVIVLSGLLVLGLGLVFDMTTEDARRIAQMIRDIFVRPTTVQPAGMPSNPNDMVKIENEIKILEQQLLYLKTLVNEQKAIRGER